MNNKSRLVKSIAVIVSAIFVFISAVPLTASADDYDYYDYSDYSYDSCYHNYDSYCVRPATYGGTGVERHVCMNCGDTYDTTFPWTLNTPDSEYHVSYNVIYHSIVYPKSKSITVKLHNGIKGSVVKVKIGKKTYKKKVGNSKKLKIKLKKRPKYGQKVSIKVYYRGQVIGENYYYYDGAYELEDDEIVYYAKKIRRGMTKKQVKCTLYWGGPDDTASASGGWSYWYYDDGSYIGFKRGRVRYWYDAAA